MLDRDGLLASFRLDPESSMPYYLQLQQQFEDLLTEGRLAAGVRIPTERELAEALGVSRMVVKRCYDALRERKWLAAHGRGGTVVDRVPSVSPRMGRLKGFAEEMREQGRTPSSRLLSSAVLSDRTIASIFGRPSSARFLHVVRVRLADNIPMSLERAWYDVEAAPDIAGWNGQGSAYEYLREMCGVTLSWADQTIEAAVTGESEMAAFGLPEPQPCLLLKRRSHSTDRSLVEYAEGMFRGDAYVYRVRLRR